VNSEPKLVGRSSSHFTRVARIFAAELAVPYSFRVLRNLSSLDVADYAGNPALRIPILECATGSWFGTLNICRELSRQSQRSLHLIWPEDLRVSLLSNAQELTVQAMTTEVALVMASLAGENLASAQHTKQHASLLNQLEWLNRNVDATLTALPECRNLSYFEVTLFCLVTHLEFRNVVSLSPYAALLEFCERFGERESARQTAFAFDP
jgi:glutathione S-transferase